jgi:DNA invertase Pin-like site-specific DNA recombinase
MPRHSTDDIAHSYIRFSHPEQRKGDSLRRQTEAAADWCRRHNVRLDTSLTLHDLGRSAYTGAHRSNPDRNALALFLKLVEAGKVPAGSYLVIENLDRLSREHIRPALTLLLNLIEAGIRVVQLKPVEMIYDQDVEPMALMMAIMELSRGHSESAIKSERVGAAWSEKKERARRGECQKATARMGDGSWVTTRRVPAWIEVRAGTPRLIPERAAAVKRIFDLACAGYGLASIVQRLTAEKVPALGPTGGWLRAYVAKILKDRRALGEYQPRGRAGAPDGDPIKGYFPAVVSEEEWLAARAGAAQRRRMPGRVGSHVNVFAGLLRNARDGDRYHVGTRPDGRKRECKNPAQRVLINMSGVEGRAARYSFPFATFEAAVLSMLREIDPHEILNGDDGPDETLALAGELAEVESSIVAISADLDAHGESPEQYRRLRQKEARKAELVKLLAEARQKAAHPLSEAWGEARTLIDALDKAPDPQDARMRLRAALRRIVESIWLLPIGRGRDRLCAVQVWFAGGERHRDYLIYHRPPLANAWGRWPGRWWARSLASVVRPGELDLRDQGHARQLEELLSAIDLDALTADLESGE